MASGWANEALRLAPSGEKVASSASRQFASFSSLASTATRSIHEHARESGARDVYLEFGATSESD
jgi:hypothetical protein